MKSKKFFSVLIVISVFLGITVSSEGQEIDSFYIRLLNKGEGGAQRFAWKSACVYGSFLLLS